MWGMETNIETWELLLVGYLIFGLAPTMTMFTGLVVGFLHGRLDVGWRWGLGTALVSSPAGSIVLVMAAELYKRDYANQSFPQWVGWAIDLAPFVFIGLLFSTVAALLIRWQAKESKSSTGTQRPGAYN